MLELRQFDGLLVKTQASDFNLSATLDSGQVFGFVREKTGQYRGWIAGSSVLLGMEGVELDCDAKPKLSERTLRDYFDLDRDLGSVYAHLDADPRLIKARQALQGLRLIRQDSWEALACFIISSNNNVKRIQGIHANLCQRLGQGVFPSAHAIAKSHTRILRELGLGYRAPFLFHTAQFVAANPQCLEVIREADYVDAVERVIAFPGIGPKVADCVLLYGFQKYEAFPVDVWIHRIMKEFFFKKTRATPEKMRQFAARRWGKEAGYVQQYLFHSARLGIFNLK